MTIKFKPIESFDTEDDRKNIASAAKLKAAAPDLYAKRNALAAAIAQGGENPAEPDKATRFANIADGKRTPVPSLKDQLREVLIAIRDNDEAQDFYAVRVNEGRKQAGKKMVLDQKPAIVAAEKELFDIFVHFHERYVRYWQAERYLRGNSISTCELFANDFDEILGAPTAVHSEFAELLRQGVAAGYIKMPKELMPK
jgi:hypothetical protein